MGILEDLPLNRSEEVSSRETEEDEREYWSCVTEDRVDDWITDFVCGYFGYIFGIILNNIW